MTRLTGDLRKILKAGGYATVAACLFVLPACSEQGDQAATDAPDAAAPDTSSAPAETLDLSTPEGALAANRKIQCSLNDGEAVTYAWRGNAFARVPGERDRLLFKLEGMNVRHCVGVEDPERGKGYRLITKEILLYLDPETGEPLRNWDNPWTGETVEVLHVANDPVNSASYVTGRGGQPLTWRAQEEGNDWWSTATVPLFYTNALGGEYQDFVGGKYHATEMFNFFGKIDDLTDASKPTADIQIGWVRMSDWLPWMEMRGRAGIIYMHTAGKKLDSWDDMPDVMKNEIAANYPEYTAPPPLDDDRPNETSWTYFKKKRPAETAAAE